ncbi:HNH endonuclease [Aureibaculum marinum]|uniref:HNH endonuclease n=1 Tax=Aureibaculum marinum TaxID=2487930 RepID=A0A3N4NDK7_9FLAO|nr:HNH endonuclease [Aureibaculum marinum]RPD93445.1 HNH endonuclease [Aureibaculum marinum]
MTLKKCIWCLKSYPEITFNKRAHTIPKSLGGQNYNKNVCDNCNEYFGNRNSHNGKYSIEEALKETFIITRKRLLSSKQVIKRKVGRFKSKFFEVKVKNGKYSLTIKSSFRFEKGFQNELARAFKRGLYKVYLEELNRQKGMGQEEKYNIIRDFARYDIGDLPVFYFDRKIGAFIMFDRESETPFLFFDRMKYLIKSEKFDEIEFLGHVFGFPVTQFNQKDLEIYFKETKKLKTEFFRGFVKIEKLTDIDLTLSLMND